MRSVIRFFLPCVLVAATAAFALPALAQDFPTRAVKIVVPYPAGGGVDGMARAIADRLTKDWGQPVVIENKGGAATMIGGEAVARSAPSGPVWTVETS